jgi:hypothetical protein
VAAQYSPDTECFTDECVVSALRPRAAERHAHGRVRDVVRGDDALADTVDVLMRDVREGDFLFSGQLRDDAPVYNRVNKIWRVQVNR